MHFKSKPFKFMESLSIVEVLDKYFLMKFTKIFEQFLAEHLAAVKCCDLWRGLNYCHFMPQIELLTYFYISTTVSPHTLHPHSHF